MNCEKCYWYDFEYEYCIWWQITVVKELKSCEMYR